MSGTVNVSGSVDSLFQDVRASNLRQGDSLLIPTNNDTILFIVQKVAAVPSDRNYVTIHLYAPATKEHKHATVEASRKLSIVKRK